MGLIGSSSQYQQQRHQISQMQFPPQGLAGGQGMVLSTQFAAQLTSQAKPFAAAQQQRNQTAIGSRSMPSGRTGASGELQHQNFGAQQGAFKPAAIPPLRYSSSQRSAMQMQFSQSQDDFRPFSAPQQRHPVPAGTDGLRQPARPMTGAPQSQLVARGARDVIVSSGVPGGFAMPSAHLSFAPPGCAPRPLSAPQQQPQPPCTTSAASSQEPGASLAQQVWLACACMHSRRNASSLQLPSLAKTCVTQHRVCACIARALARRHAHAC